MKNQVFPTNDDTHNHATSPKKHSENQQDRTETLLSFFDWQRVPKHFQAPELVQKTILNPKVHPCQLSVWYSS
jgi:hypothetical protein